MDDFPIENLHRIPPLPGFRVNPDPPPRLLRVVRLEVCRHEVVVDLNVCAPLAWKKGTGMPNSHGSAMFFGHLRKLGNSLFGRRVAGDKQLGISLLVRSQLERRNIVNKGSPL